MNELDLILTRISNGLPVCIENQEVYNGLTNYISELVSTACIEGVSYELDEIASIYFSVEANYGGEFDLPLKKQCANSAKKILSNTLKKTPDDEDLKLQMQYCLLVEKYCDSEQSYSNYLEKGNQKMADSCMADMEDIKEQMQEIIQLRAENIRKH